MIVEVWTDADFELWIDGAPFECVRTRTASSRS